MLVRRKHRSCCLALSSVCLVLGLTLTTCNSQVQAESEHSISGVVFDSLLGLPVQDALVRLTGSSFTASTNSAGRFEFVSIPAGLWTATVTRYGYVPSAPQAVEVLEGFERHLRVKLVPKPIALGNSLVVRSPISRTAATGVRTYDSRQIQRAGHRTVADALDAIPGVRIYGSSETSGGTRVSVGGASPERVAVLLDGVPLASGSAGAVDLDVIPLSAVKSIEVSPGSRSAGSGDAAIGGSVNLLTSSASQTIRQDLELSTGSFGAYRGTANSGFNLGANRIEGALETNGRGHQFSYPDGDSTAKRQGVQAHTWRGFAGFSSAGQRGPHVSAFVYNSTVGIPGALEQLQPGAATHNVRLRAQGSWPWLQGKHVSAEGALWYESGEDHVRSLETRIKTDSDWRERFIGARQKLGLSLGSANLGGEFEVRSRRMEGTDRVPSQSFGVHDQTEFSLRALAKGTSGFPGGIVSLTLMGAADGDQRSTPVYSPRADMEYAHRGGVYVRLGWGRSFRRPPLTSLFWKSDAFVAGNPNLKPERAVEWDLTAGVHRGGFLLESRYFERSLRDIISWERGAMGRYQPRNVPRAFTFGREDHASLELWHAGLTLSYSHIFTAASDRSGEVNHDGMVLVMSPRHTHDLSADFSAGRISGRLSGRWVSSRELRRDNVSGKTLAPYRLFDAYARIAVRRLPPSLTLGIRVNNITNERVDLLERYPSPGRTVSVETVIAF
ncbi:MAG: TonB-dependent receptor [candidate division Zixibacteria bacterium]|nr:TonB-dependent receptor [candidate division Zixibacteria bacterium]